jgi:hypothetical protein
MSGIPTSNWRRRAAAILAAAALAGCGGGGGDSPTPPPNEAPQSWLAGDGGIQAFGTARAVEMGFDGATSYVRQDGYTHARPGVFGATLAYIGASGAPAAGQATQWLRFAMRGDGYFATQAQHLPIGLNFAQYPDPRVAQSAPLGVEGRMIFFGRGGWDCASASSISAYFETRISGRVEQPDVLGVKCAHDALGLRDGAWYQVEISAGPQGIAYSIADETGHVLSTGATADLDYPPSDWSQPLLDQMADPGSVFHAHYADMTRNREFGFVAASTTNGSAWSLTFTRINPAGHRRADGHAH